MPGQRHLVELSHVIRHGMTTYPGLPGPVISDHLSFRDSRATYDEGTEFQIGLITMVANTGTYLDSPAHRYQGGADLSGLPLERLADLDGLVVRLPAGTRVVDSSFFASCQVSGRAVLIHSGWDRHWGTGTYLAGGHPHLTADAADWLVAHGAALVGIDSLNIDDNATASRPVHSALLAAGIPVVEHLTNLAALPLHGFRFHAAPPLVAGMGTFPVRAYAVVDAAKT